MAVRVIGTMTSTENPKQKLCTCGAALEYYERDVHTETRDHSYDAYIDCPSCKRACCSGGVGDGPDVERHMTIKMLALDIDGVLNSVDYMVANPGSFDRSGPDHRDMLDPAACARLNRVLQKTGAVIVISSTWRINWSGKQVEGMLHARGCPAAIVIGETPRQYGKYRDGDDALIELAYGRGVEIQMWLDEHPEVTKFAIVDDSDDMVHLKHKLVRTSAQHGLLDEHADRLIEMLNA